MMKGTRTLTLPPVDNGPQEAFLRLFHRSPDGNVALATTNPTTGTWQELGAWDVTQPLLPTVLEMLAVNGRFSLNASFAAFGKRPRGTRQRWIPIQRTKRPPEEVADLRRMGVEEEFVELTHWDTHHPKTGLRYASHKTETLRWLTCVHTDIDCYKKGLTVGKALGAIVDMQDREELPPASLFCRSGRGLWAFWLLVDPENPEEGERSVFGVRHTPTTPARATWKARQTFAKVAGEIGRRLKPLGADLPAMDMVRSAPVHGSLKHGPGAPPELVKYWLQGAYDGSPYVYTLADLAQMLSCELKTAEHPVVAQALSDSVSRQERRSVAGRRGHRKRWQHALTDFEMLLRLRGEGFNEGIRHKGAFYYALLLRKSGMDQDDALDRVAKFGRCCRPPLDQDEIKAAIRQGYKPRAGVHVSHAKLRDDLDISDRELTYLPHFSGQGRAKPLAPTKQEQASRREALRRLVETHGQIPVRDLAALQGRDGFTMNVATCWRDLKALGYQPKGKPGRPKTRKLFQD